LDNNIKIDLKIRVRGHGLGSGQEYRLVAGFFEYGNGPLGSIKGKEFHD
jgi:hypothetical protein